MGQRRSIAGAIKQAAQGVTTPEPITNDPIAPRPYKVARTREGKKMIAAPVDPAARQTLKVLAAELDRKSEDLIREALGDLFTKYGKPRIV
jgi:hypothetical protein